MKLKRFIVTDFRSVINSGWVDCDDVTTLVGVNESGKSNILLALWKLNPVSGGAIDILHDMPVSKLAELRNKTNETWFVEAVFSLTDTCSFFSTEFGFSFSPDDELCIKRFYDGHYNWSFINKEIDENIRTLTEGSIGEDGEEIKAKYTSDDLCQLIQSKIPGFVYYSNYGNLSSKVYLPHAVRWLRGEKIPGFELREDQARTLRVLFKYVNLEPEEIQRLGKDANAIALESGRPNSATKEDISQADKNKEQRGLLLQSAGTKLTKDFKDWWKQGNYVFRFDTDGDYFRIWVSDEVRPESVSLELRSTGLQWFLSFFLVFLVECSEDKKDAILLLDEAGLTLHPMAQKDLSLFFNKLSENNQIINTTHSPFLVDTDHIDRCRVVYSDEKGGTIVSENLREGSNEIGLKSIYAVHAALGLTVSDVMLQGSQVVVVEGVSDQFYLSTIKNVLIRDKKISPQKEIVFVPAGGVKGVSGIVSLVCAKNENLPFVVLDSDLIGNDFKNKLEKGLYKDSKDRIISVGSLNSIEEAEIEDLIPFDIIEKKIQTLLNSDAEEDEFKHDGTKALVPQIENYAKDRGITLVNGWKVDLARSFCRKMNGKTKISLPDTIVKTWIDLFERIEEK